MTFEEFLIKKKIDPVQFSINEPALFSEFRSHFAQMGEKSFDHSKKFLFNKLRRANHLVEEAKPAREIVGTNLTASGASPLIAQGTDNKVDKALLKTELPGSDTREGSTEKPAYKPRFKAAIPAPVQEQSPASGQLNESGEDEKPKPIYKPRFKAPIPLPEEKQPVNEEGESKPADEEPVKPVYKPRFKPGMTKPDPDKQ